MKSNVSNSFTEKEVCLLAEILTKMLRKADTSAFVRNPAFKSLAIKQQKMSDRIRRLNEIDTKSIPEVVKGSSRKRRK